MDYKAWLETHLSRVEIDDRGRSVSVWCSEPSEKPLLLLVHGISGDHIGLVPLAAELTKTYRIALLDLPGHGSSDQMPIPSAKVLQTWFDEVVKHVEHAIGPIEAVFAHSFGCSAVVSDETLAKRNIILCNPVPTPSGMYATYSRMIMDSAHFWAHVYNWPPFILLRGMTLAKDRSREARRRVRWTGLNSRPSFEQIIFQASLVDMILDGSAYRHAQGGRVGLVLCGMYDTTATERDTIDMEKVFGITKTAFLKGGHLLPIEMPERVAQLIREHLV